ncbi:hypothetical protein [Caulobacter sp. BE254]|uniref:hypothetical protein n=1 Tax=Caulobacter sp. BE254 TaxID=2817720 RepID=UPI002866C71D|nr:hypothetical protein [Caulobacter sp. BE254]MDR7116655.1 hypothetical protein [Caulobacter sp. BE254]
MSAPDDYDDDDDNDDWPMQWADPAIRQDYEAALGRLILAHNDVDVHLTELIACCLRRLGNPPALERLAHGMFAKRLESLEILQALPVQLNLNGMDIANLRRLNNLRNIVAHGHFEQDPFGGEYTLLSNRERRSDFPTERLNKITKELNAEAGSLHANTAFYDALADLILPD